MKTPFDVVDGTITDIQPDGRVTIQCYYPDWVTLTRRQYKDCKVRLLDSRKRSPKQLRSCHALIRAISDYTGYGMDSTKEYMKLKFLIDDMERTADDMFSLSDAPMSLVCAFQKFLIKLILDWDIPCDFRLLDMVDDINDYVYACAIRQKCCVCGQEAEMHHHDRVGMGRNRNEIENVGMHAEPLCRLHHTECHQMGQKLFDDKYHLKPIVIDKPLVKIWGLNTNMVDESEESVFNYDDETFE